MRLLACLQHSGSFIEFLRQSSGFVSATLLSMAQLQERVLVCCVMMGRIIIQTQYSPTPVIRTSIIRTEFRTWSLSKKVVFLIKIAVSATEQSIYVCVSYVHVQCRHTVVRHRVQCEL